MSEFKKGQAVTATLPRGIEKQGKYIGETNLGPGRGQGIYAQVEIDGKTMKVRPSRLRAA